jgi:chemotaxis protein histidine kinase CheA
MSGLLSGAAGVVGSTLTSDGGVLLVLNLAELLA